MQNIGKNDPGKNHDQNDPGKNIGKTKWGRTLKKTKNGEEYCKNEVVKTIGRRKKNGEGM